VLAASSTNKVYRCGPHREAEALKRDIAALESELAAEPQMAAAAAAVAESTAAGLMAGPLHLSSF
jgi:hypothetical protein